MISLRGYLYCSFYRIIQIDLIPSKITVPSPAFLHRFLRSGHMCHFWSPSVLSTVSSMDANLSGCTTHRSDRYYCIQDAQENARRTVMGFMREIRHQRLKEAGPTTIYTEYRSPSAITMCFSMFSILLLSVGPEKVSSPDQMPARLRCCVRTIIRRLDLSLRTIRRTHGLKPLNGALLTMPSRSFIVGKLRW